MNAAKLLNTFSILFLTASISLGQSEDIIEPPAPVATVNQILTNQVGEDLLRLLPEVDKAQCTDYIEGQFSFCVSIPVRYVVGKVELEDRWETCLRYNPVTCCHEWVKYKVEVPVQQAEVRHKAEKKNVCVKLRVPKDVVLAAPPCDCPLPGSGLPTPLTAENEPGNSQVDANAQLVESRKPVFDDQPEHTTEPLVFDSFDLLSKFVSTARANPPTKTEQVQVEPVELKQNNTNFGGSILQFQNANPAEVSIASLSFRPRRVIENKSSESELWDAALKSKARTIVLSESSNRGRGDLHGVYVLNSAQALAFPPTHDTSLTIVINNKKHLGWGLEGDLELQTDNGDLTVKSVRVLFVNIVESESTQ